MNNLTQYLVVFIALFVVGLNAPCNDTPSIIGEIDGIPIGRSELESHLKRVNESRLLANADMVTISDETAAGYVFLLAEEEVRERLRENAVVDPEEVEDAVKMFEKIGGGVSEDDIDYNKLVYKMLQVYWESYPEDEDINNAIYESFKDDFPTSRPLGLNDWRNYRQIYSTEEDFCCLPLTLEEAEENARSVARLYVARKVVAGKRFENSKRDREETYRKVRQLWDRIGKTPDERQLRESHDRVIFEMEYSLWQIEQVKSIVRIEDENIKAAFEDIMEKRTRWAEDFENYTLELERP